MQKASAFLDKDKNRRSGLNAQIIDVPDLVFRQIMPGRRIQIKNVGSSEIELLAVASFDEISILEVGIDLAERRSAPNVFENQRPELKLTAFVEFGSPNGKVGFEMPIHEIASDREWLSPENPIKTANPRKAAIIDLEKMFDETNVGFLAGIKRNLAVFRSLMIFQGLGNDADIDGFLAGLQAFENHSVQSPDIIGFERGARIAGEENLAIHLFVEIVKTLRLRKEAAGAAFPIEATDFLIKIVEAPDLGDARSHHVRPNELFEITAIWIPPCHSPSFPTIGFLPVVWTETLPDSKAATNDLACFTIFLAARR
jgi:hypothetical protein